MAKSDDTYVHKAARYHKQDVETAEQIAEQYAQGNFSLVMRRALEIGLEKIGEDPALLLGKQR